MPKWIIIGTLLLFSVIGIAGVIKKKNETSSRSEERTVNASSQPIKEASCVQAPVETTGVFVPMTLKEEPSLVKQKTSSVDDFPNIDRVFQLFSTTSSKLPIVETIAYSSTVSWLKGRPAWISDYAVHFNTSRHFIARSLNGRPDYFSQKVKEGSHFNVFRQDKNIQFYLLVDVSRCKMGFYYFDLDTNERVLLKTYRVGLGRLEPSKPSGTATPIGKYLLGKKVAIYKPNTMGTYLDQNIEMIRVFGTRWIPFEQEVVNGSKITRGGYGLQGVPWEEDPTTGQLKERLDLIGVYQSDGCIRLTTEDIEELFSIVITKPTFIVIVKDFHEANLPGVEIAAPSSKVKKWEH